MTDQYTEDQDLELHDDVENEVVEEAHDPKNAEEQSVAATKKAGEAGPKAPARKGDKKNSQPSELKKTAKMENADFSEVLENVDYDFKHPSIICTEIVDVITEE